jgi:hypothetical protein
MTISKNSLIRTIYLYSFSLLGLILMVIGSVNFLDMGMRAFIFTKADEGMNDNYMMSCPPTAVMEKFGKVDGNASESFNLTIEDKEMMSMWKQDYKNWKDMPKVDYVTQQRHRDASNNLALIVIGLPLYLYHWFVIRKELKNAK